MSLVRITDIIVDDWGVSARITRVRDLVDHGSSTSRNFRAAWGIFSFNKHYWDARYIAASIYFHWELIEEVMENSEIMADEPPDIAFFEINNAIIDYLYRKDRD